MSGHDALHPFFDGELPPQEADAFRAHLGGCAKCQAELLELMQLQAISTPDAKAPQGATVTPLRPKARETTASPPRRSNVIPFRQRTAAFAAAGAALAALVIWGAFGLTRAPGPAEGPMLALASTRRLEPRLAYPGAARYRPYQVERSGSEAAFERVSLAALEQLEAKGDRHGAAAGHLLRGDWKEAAALLESVPESPDALNDRAVLALAQERPEAALALLDDVLERAPLHGPALFNRALALQRLGLPFAAAEAFEAAAKRDEAGWAKEAAERAAAIQKAEETRRRAWEQTWRAGEAMVQGGDALAIGAARAFPGMARLLFYDAVRTAGSAERVTQLRALAAALDAAAGDGVLRAHLEKVAKRSFAVRAPLAARYRALAKRSLSAAEVADLIGDLRAAREEDMLLGALWYAGQVAARASEYRTLAQRSGDAWFSLNADLEESKAELERADYTRSEQRLSEALGRCEKVEPPYRCAQLNELLTRLLTQQHRLPEASARAKAGLALARRGQEWAQETQFLQWLGEIARFRGERALTRAYLTEATLRHPGHCPAQMFLAQTLASLEVLALRPEAARAELGRAPACGPYSPVGATVLLALARVRPQPDDGARLAAALAPLRAPGVTEGSRAVAEVIDGAFLMLSNPEQGERKVRDGLSLAEKVAPTDADGVRARSLAHNTLVLEAGRAKRFDVALHRLGEATGVTAPERCVLGAALDDERLLFVAAGPDGEVQGSYDGARHEPVDEARDLVPTSLLDRLRGCETVGVLARPPLHGRAELLPPTLAWSYLGPRSETEPGEEKGSTLIVADVEPPASLGLPRLGAFNDDLQGIKAPVVLRGAAATPDRVLAELEHASYAELHAHGLVNASASEASLLVLSPRGDGRYALSAGEVAKARFPHHPVVVLGACRAGQTAFQFYEPWSLPVAFVRAGAKAVIASPDDIPDAEAAEFMAGLRTRLLAGEAPEIAVRDARQRALASGQNNWVRRVLVFR